ncbi:MAG TPA: TlpA disulfide reductase family protein [Anaeromyxobacteraceae bacterium]|nr:TlpA disulfide reductase family protein [Anaeromyxobacteraceae bacterium]
MVRAWRAAALAAALVAAAGCAASRPPRASPLLGRTVRIAAPDLAGHTVRIEADGARVRVVEFWASWCEPCRDQFPFLDRLLQAYGASGLSVHGVSLDEDRAQIDAFLRDVPVRFSVLWDKGGASLSGPLAIDRLPTTLVLDGEGAVRHVQVGGGAPQREALERAVRSLLGR